MRKMSEIDAKMALADEYVSKLEKAHGNGLLEIEVGVPPERKRYANTESLERAIAYWQNRKNQLLASVNLRLTGKRAPLFGRSKIRGWNKGIY